MPNHAYRPFGNGERACIGMQFALYEAALVVGMIIKHFELIDFSNYQLQVKQTLTIKPDHFQMKIKPRLEEKHTNMDTSSLHASLILHRIFRLLYL